MRFGRLGRWAPVGATLPLACALAVLALVGVAGLIWNTSPGYGRPQAAPSVGPSPAPSSSSSHPPASSTAAARETVLLSPHRVVIPKLRVHAKVINVGTTGGALDVPLNPRVLGWWSPGARPGAATGTAIIAGHINYAGVEGALANIGTLRPGDEVDVYGIDAGHQREIRFAVTGVRTYHKSSLPYRTIFSQDVPGRLVLVTCGGPFDAATGNYLDNIVTYAEPRT